MYLVDKQGYTRYLAIGEGNYEHTEAAIKALLAEEASGTQCSSKLKPAEPGGNAGQWPH